MKSKEFVINQINELIELFPDLTIKYEYEALSKSHYIQVLPIELYENNERYRNKEKSIYIDFIELYPCESISFVSAEDDYDFVGANVYKRHVFINNFDLNVEFTELFGSYMADIPSKINLKSTIRSQSNYSYNSVSLYLGEKEISQILIANNCGKNTFHEEFSDDMFVEIESVGEDNNALAA